MLSLRHIQPRFGVEEMTEKQRSEFLVKWAKRSAFTWQELTQQQKHGLGWNDLDAKAIKPSIPSSLKQNKFMVFRHERNMPFVGFKAGDTFFVLWIETKWNEVYDHGKK
jgi:hypothetical protein